MSEPLTAHPRSRGADALLIGITSFWGISFAIVKDALADSDAFTFLALRFAVAAAASVAVQRRALLDRALWRPAVVLGLFLFLGFLTQTWGLETTTPSRSAVITSLFVVFVPLCQWALFSRRPAPVAFGGAALAIGGTYVLSGADFSGGLTRGDWLTVACAAAYAVHITLTGRWAKGRSPGALVGVQMMVVAVLSAAVVPLGPMRVHASWGFALAVLSMGVVATTVFLSAQTWAQSRTSAVRAALILALEPVFAAAWSMGRGHEPYEPKVVLGGGLVLLGVVIAELFKGQPAQEPARAP
jgi:drug/metabolite transporter (DMT)-like permease